MEYNIDIPQMAANMLPPDKRLPVMKAWCRWLLSPMGWLNELMLDEYLNNTFYVYYDLTNTTPYTATTRVIYHYAVYECIQNCTGISPDNTAYWMQVLPSFIRVTERICYNGNLLTLTYALNRYFNTVFRQPAAVTGQSPLSDIYLTSFDDLPQSFIAGAAETDSSCFVSIGSVNYIINALSDNPLFDFAIHIPSAVFSAILPPGNDDYSRERVVRAFADKYVIAGINYQVVTY